MNKSGVPKEVSRTGAENKSVLRDLLCCFCGLYLVCPVWQTPCGDRLCGPCYSDRFTRSGTTRPPERFRCTTCLIEVAIEDCFRDRATEYELAESSRWKSEDVDDCDFVYNLPLRRARTGLNKVLILSSFTPKVAEQTLHRSSPTIASATAQYLFPADQALSRLHWKERCSQEEQGSSGSDSESRHYAMENLVLPHLNIASESGQCWESAEPIDAPSQLHFTRKTPEQSCTGNTEVQTLSLPISETAFDSPSELVIPR